MIDKGTGGKLVGPLLMPNGVEVTLLDEKYNFYPKADILALLKAIPVEKYVPDFHDCDNFAQDASVAVLHKLPGCAIGIAIGHSKTGGSHAVNVYWAKVGNKVQRYYYDNTARTELIEFNVEKIIV